MNEDERKARLEEIKQKISGVHIHVVRTDIEWLLFEVERLENEKHAAWDAFEMYGDHVTPCGHGVVPCVCGFSELGFPNVDR